MIGREPLTPREKEVIRSLARGSANKQIGAELFISERTVKNHLYNIFGKLGIEDRVTLVLYALRTGLAEIPEVDAA